MSPQSLSSPIAMRSTVFFLGIFVLAAANVTGPITDDFLNWLNSNGYVGDNFARADYGTQGSFGGKSASATKASNNPVIFVHGNSDTALRTTNTASGWDNSIAYFLGYGYTSAELYATSWGDNMAKNAATRTHNCHDLLRLRRFVQAVLAYTASPKVSIVTHSMGVTLMRKAVKGGSVSASDGSCSLGSSLAKSVDVFVGLAGGNYGLCNCEGSGTIEKTCNKQNGLWPGDSCGMNYLTCGATPLPFPCNAPTYSKFLMDLNADMSKEADYVFSCWSTTDNLILYGDMVWGRPTSYIPTSTAKHVYPNYTHMQTKELTAADQYNMVKNRKVPS